MLHKVNPITVHQIPAQVTAMEERRFLQALQPFVAGERPRLVLDCSEIRHMDDATTHLLLCCLEAAMKSNGDVKLAALTEANEEVLRNIQAHRLFEMYPTPAAAIRSFSSYFSLESQPATATMDFALRSRNAA